LAQWPDVGEVNGGLTGTPGAQRLACFLLFSLKEHIIDFASSNPGNAGWMSMDEGAVCVWW